MTDKTTLDVYSERVDEYVSVPVTGSQAEALAGFLGKLPPQSHILDLGCGPGLHAAEMMEAGHQVTALDATPEFVTAAKALGVDARLGRFDDVTERAAYDAVWASFSLLHAPRTEFPRHVAAVHRALRPGGVLFLGMKLGQGEERDALGRFYSYYSEEELRERLAQAGFTAIEAVRGTGKGLAGTDDPYILMTAYA